MAEAVRTPILKNLFFGGETKGVGGGGSGNGKIGNLQKAFEMSIQSHRIVASTWVEFARTNYLGMSG